MTTLDNLSKEDKAHWLLHLNALNADNPTESKTIKRFVDSKMDLPNIEYPSYIHIWFEEPDKRNALEIRTIG